MRWSGLHQAQLRRVGDGASGNFTSDTRLPIPNDAGTLVQAIRLLTEFRIGTPLLEESRLRIFGRRAGVDIEIGGFAMGPGGGLPMLFVGDLADGVGFRTGHSNLDVLVGGASPESWSPTAVNVHKALICESDLQFGTNTGSMNGNRFDPSLGNYAVVPGTPTINGINTGTKTTGYRIDLKVANGTTLVNNSGAPGTGALKLINLSAGNIVTTSVRVIPYVLDLVDGCWYQEG